VRKDDIAEDIFFIQNGIVEVVSEDGFTVFDTMKSGESFGEVGVMYNIPRAASVRAQVGRANILNACRKQFGTRSQAVASIAERSASQHIML